MFEDLIKARIERFNRLWLKAEGHTFEDDPKVKKEIYDREMVVWQEKMDKRLAELGFENEDAYHAYLFEQHSADPEFERDPKIVNLWKARPIYNSLYNYEMYVIEEAKKMAEFISNMEGDNKDIWNKLSNNGDASTFDFVKNIEKEGFIVRGDHSGNSVGATVNFAMFLLFHPDLFPYQHGALCYLVGDSGYHDDRSDIPKPE